MHKSLNEHQKNLTHALGLQPDIFDSSRHAVVQLEGAILHLQLFEQNESQILVLMSQLGSINEKAKLNTYSLLLSANLSWKSVAGGTLAIASDTDEAILIIRLDLKHMSELELNQRLYACIDAAEKWGARIFDLNSNFQSSNIPTTKLNKDNKRPTIFV